MEGTFEDMKRSYAPEKFSSGSLIPCVAAPKLEQIKIIAKATWPGEPKIYHDDSFFSKF
jgi:hypothetical protein